MDIFLMFYNRQQKFAHSPPDLKFKPNPRVINAGYMIVCFPDNVFDCPSPATVILKQSADFLVDALGLIISKIMAIPLATPFHWPDIEIHANVFPQALRDFLRDFTSWKVPDEARVCVRIEDALNALHDAQKTLQVSPDTPANIATSDEIRNQLQRLQDKHHQILGRDSLIHFFDCKVFRDALVELYAEFNRLSQVTDPADDMARALLIPDILDKLNIKKIEYSAIAGPDALAHFENQRIANELLREQASENDSYTSLTLPQCQSNRNNESIFYAVLSNPKRTNPEFNPIMDPTPASAATLASRDKIVSDVCEAMCLNLYSLATETFFVQISTQAIIYLNPRSLDNFPLKLLKPELQKEDIESQDPPSYSAYSDSLTQVIRAVSYSVSPHRAKDFDQKYADLITDFHKLSREDPTVWIKKYLYILAILFSEDVQFITLDKENERIRVLIPYIKANGIRDLKETYLGRIARKAISTKNVQVSLFNN